jgi:thioredoxin-disulfide reductase
MYDLVIAGAGPAGITAAIYASRKMLKTLVVSKDIGGQAALSASIENYTGYQFIPGPELARRFHEHVNGFNIEHVDNTEVLSVEKKGDYFTVRTSKGDYESKTVILALGGRPRMLGVPGEREFRNRGVTSCATCDGPLFRDKDVAVIGGGNAALDAALQLMGIAGKVYLVTINDGMWGDPIMLEKVKSSPKVEIIVNAETLGFYGDVFLKQVRLLVDKSVERTLSVEGAFIEVGWTPALIPVVSDVGNLALNNRGEVVVNERCETNIPGLFAAGDVTSVPERQIIVAAGQGCISALSAFKYLSKKV